MFDKRLLPPRVERKINKLGKGIVGAITELAHGRFKAVHNYRDALDKVACNILLDDGIEYVIETIEMTDGTAPRSIKCTICGKKSYNENDIKNKYCGHCHKFLRNKNDEQI